MAVPYHTHTFEIPSATKSEVEAGIRDDVAATPSSLGSAAAKDVSYFATASQGGKADAAVQSVNGKTGNTVVLDKTDIGLGNVDNTSDLSKPISSDTQAALDLKADKAITVSSGTGLTGGGTLASNRTIALSSTSIASLALADTSVQPARLVSAGTGLTGGGSLAADRTISLSTGSVASLAKADSALQAPGGATGQVLTKNSATDNDVSWQTVAGATAVSYAPQTLSTAQQNQVAINLGNRERLRANRTYYVRTDGSNSNDGLTNSAGGAFLTIQYAYDFLVKNVDLNGFDVTIQVVDGTYTTGLDIVYPLVGSGLIILRGNTTTPANCIISVTNSTCLRNRRRGMTLRFSGFQFFGTTSAWGVWADGGNIEMDGNCTFSSMPVGDHLRAINGGLLTISANYTVIGSTVNHWHAFGLGNIICSGVTITIGNPVTMTRWCGVATAVITADNCTFTNKANVNGARYLVHRNGTIITEGAGDTYFPGGTAGTVATGGQYV